MPKILFVAIILLSTLSMPLKAADNAADTTSYRISLVTCYPGPVVYELYGHTAIRIVHDGMDKVYNFGMFSFSKPNFIYRFVKGETDYALGGYPFEYFLPEYIERNSKVVEQVLNLDKGESRRLFERLEFLCLPEHREYRYNYVLDNCATRPRDMIEAAVGGLDYAPMTDDVLTFRKMMRSYSSNYPWYQFGIDLALGSGIDYPIDTRKQLFAPLYLEKAFSTAMRTTPDGQRQPIVKETITLFDGSESPVLPPTPWYLTPTAAAIAILLIIAAVTMRDVRRGKESKWIDCLWFSVTGLTGCLVFFLVFISEHEATSPNYLAFWLNPFCLIGAILTWIKSAKRWLYFYHLINFALDFILLSAWWWLPQSANAAFFPLMLCSVIRSANYVIILRNAKKKASK